MQAIKDVHAYVSRSDEFLVRALSVLTNKIELQNAELIQCIIFITVMDNFFSCNNGIYGSVGNNNLKTFRFCLLLAFTSRKTRP